MSDSKKSQDISVVAAALVVVTVGATLLIMTHICANHSGYVEAQKTIRTEAVERGFAEWVPDSGGNTTFKWKEAAK